MFVKLKMHLQNVEIKLYSSICTTFYNLLVSMTVALEQLEVEEETDVTHKL